MRTQGIEETVIEKNRVSPLVNYTPSLHRTHTLCHVICTYQDPICRLWADYEEQRRLVQSNKNSASFVSGQTTIPSVDTLRDLTT